MLYVFIYFFIFEENNKSEKEGYPIMKHSSSFFFFLNFSPFRLSCSFKYPDRTVPN